MFAVFILAVAMFAVGVMVGSAAGGKASYSEWWKAQSQTVKQFHISGGHQSNCIKAANAHDEPPKTQDETNQGENP